MALRGTIGDVKVRSLDDARAEARRLQGLIEQSIDPRQEKAAGLPPFSLHDLRRARPAAHVAREDRGLDSGAGRHRATGRGGRNSPQSHQVTSIYSFND